MSGIKQGSRGLAKIGSGVGALKVACRIPGSGISRPENLDSPYPGNNQAHGELNHARGFSVPECSLAMMILKNIGGRTDWWTAPTLNGWFLDNSVGDDLAEIAGGIEFWDAVTDATDGGKTLLGAKGVGFELSFGWAQEVMFNASFMGVDIGTPGSVPSDTGLIGDPLQYDGVTFTGGLSAHKIIGGSLRWGMNPMPNPEMGGGSLNASEINTGLPQGMLSLRTNAGVPLANSRPNQSGGTGAIVVNGVTFAITKAICLNPDDRQHQTNRVIRTYNYKLYASTTAKAIVIS